MRQTLGCLLVALLALPALRADDKPKDDKPKEEKKDLSPKEQYDAVLKEYNAERAKLVADINKAKGEERDKLIQKYYGLGKDFADKLYKIAEDNPKEPVAKDVIFWVLQNGAGSAAAKKAADKFAGMVADIPLKDLAGRLRFIRTTEANVFQAVYDRAVKDEKEAGAVDLLAWVATVGETQRPGEKAAERLFEKHPENAAVDQICSAMAHRADGTERLKKILDSDKNSGVKAAAALALGQSLAERTDDLAEKPEEADKVAAEAEKYFVMVVDQFAKDDANRKKTGEKMLRVLRNLRVGKEAPDIKGADLDEKEFKLSDYRGKVVLLDFWGNW